MRHPKHHWRDAGDTKCKMRITHSQKSWLECCIANEEETPLERHNGNFIARNHTEQGPNFSKISKLIKIYIWILARTTSNWPKNPWNLIWLELDRKQLMGRKEHGQREVEPTAKPSMSAGVMHIQTWWYTVLLERKEVNIINWRLVWMAVKRGHNHYGS